MGALAVVAFKVRGQVQSVLIWIALNLVLTFTIANISWQGHIGGLVGGAVIGAAMVYAPRAHRSLVQWTAHRRWSWRSRWRWSSCASSR